MKPSVREIKQRACSYYQVTQGELIGEEHTRHLVRARHVAIYLARSITGRSLSALGAEFGNRDHTSIHYAIQKVERSPELQTEASAVMGAPFGICAHASLQSRYSITLGGGMPSRYLGVFCGDCGEPLGDPADAERKAS